MEDRSRSRRNSPCQISHQEPPSDLPTPTLTSTTTTTATVPTTTSASSSSSSSSPSHSLPNGGRSNNVRNNCLKRDCEEAAAALQSTSSSSSTNSPQKSKPVPVQQRRASSTSSSSSSAGSGSGSGSANNSNEELQSPSPSTSHCHQLPSSPSRGNNNNSILRNMESIKTENESSSNLNVRSTSTSKSNESQCETGASSSSSASSSSHGMKLKCDENGHDQEDLPHNRIRRGNVCEAWQSTKSCLKERISYLFNNDTLSDVSFLVGRGRVRIPGHKFVLAIGSPVFDAMFNGPLQESNRTVELPDVEPEAFLALLKFLYSDEVSVSAESVLTVLYTAKKYAVPTLEEHCVAFLKDNLTAENAFLLLSQARLFDEPQLAALCLDCIDKNTGAAISADGFLEVDLATLSAVLERDTLRIREYNLFHAVLRWAASECSRRGMEVTPENQRYSLGRALNLIRFPLMPVEEFAIGVAQLGLLSETELVRLFLNFNISSTNLEHRPKMEFIDRPRCYMTGKQLSVYRFQQVETRWGYNGLSDQIRFTTDRRIYVVGFGLYGGLYGTKEYRVDIQISNTLANTVLGHTSDSFVSDGSKTTFKIMFKEPIEILPDLLYTASATLRGPDSHYGAKGQRKVGVECPDGTTVNFNFSYSSDNNNGTSVEDGQIPELIFHT